MVTKVITIKWVDLAYDAKANTWKTGNIGYREDGQHAETQMDDDGVDIDLAKRSAVDGTQKLAEALQYFVTDTTGATTLRQITDTTTWTISLQVSGRNPSTATQLSALGHAYVLAHICADWYRNMNDNVRENDWVARQNDAEMRLRAAIYKKNAPTLPAEGTGG